MNIDDKDYLERRAHQELDCAQNSTCPEAVYVHYQLLGHYLDQLYGGDEAGTGLNPVERAKRHLPLH